MKNLKNSLFISLIIGLSLSLFFSMLFADGKYYPLNPQSTIGILYYNHFTETTVMLISIILWLLIGVVFFLGDFIFKYTDWSITKATIMHFITTYVGFLPLAMLAGWFPLTAHYLIIFTIIFIVVYVLIWIIQFFKNKNYVDTINKQLKQLK